MSQVELLLKRLRTNCGLSHLDDIYALYDSVPNEDLQALLAAYHTSLNLWLGIINDDIRYDVDGAGNRISRGGYFHAEDSRNYLSIIEEIDQLKTKLHGTKYAFTICNANYEAAISQARKFVKKSGGSNIPEDYESVDIEELAPIFQLASGVTITRDRQSIYVGTKKIGSGSYAEVYSYNDPLYDIPIVIKRARPELDAKELARFRQEFDVMKSLHSPYVVEVFTYDDEKNEYTMEYAGETIGNFVGRFLGVNRNKLPLQKRKALIAQLCYSLEYIHSKGLFHRDLSHTNVFVKHYDDVDIIKLGDFGLVKIPQSNMTSLLSDVKGAFNDPDLINVGFANYGMCHEIYALTRLCTFILIGQASVRSLKDGAVKHFWETGTNPDRNKRFESVNDVLSAVKRITQQDIEQAL